MGEKVFDKQANGEYSFVKTRIIAGMLDTPRGVS